VPEKEGLSAAHETGKGRAEGLIKWEKVRLLRNARNGRRQVAP
jgi:hypothetical protein